MEARILYGPESDHSFDQISLGEFFYKMSQKHGDKIAQIDPATDERQTFNDIRKRSIRTAIEMSKRGITSKDIVVFCTVNCLDNIIPLLGATFLGAKVASLDPTLSLKHIQHLLKIVQPAMIFVESKSLNLIEQAVGILENSPSIVIFGESSKYPTMNDFIKPVDNEGDFKFVRINPKDPAILFFSSGTTGLPKAICLSSQSILHCINTLHYSSIKLDSILNFSTLYWISGITTIIANFYAGSYRVLIQQFSVDETFKIIEKYKVTYIIMGPIIAYKLATYENLKSFDISSLNTLMVGGTPVSSTHLQRIRESFKNANVMVAYGLTEGGFVAFFHPDRDRKYLKTKLQPCGKISPGVTVKITNPDTEELLSPYQKGEICIKSPSVMLGYHKADSSQVFDKDGFLKTGDIGYYDDNECLYVVDRIKEVFKYQSWHIIPYVIEEVLLEHPAVLEACVFGVPHEVDGEVPAAWVVLKAGKSVTPGEIAEFVARKVLDRERLRAGVRIVEKLPKTSTGKLMRREAKSQMIASMEGIQTQQHE